MIIGTERLRLALPDSAEFDAICAHLRRCGFDLPDLSLPGLHRVTDPLGVGVDFDVFRLSPVDVGTYVEHGIAHLGVLSTDIIREADAQLWRPFTFSYGTYPIVLAAPQGLTLDHLSSRPIMRLATSLPDMTRGLFAARGMSIEVVPVEDSATACLLGLADGYADRLADPELLISQGFRVLEVIGHAHLKLTLNSTCYPSRRDAIDELVHRLYTHQPPEPEPIAIPFDVED